jgi:DNA primase
MESVDGRARLAELAIPLVQKIPHGIYRDLLTERLSETVGLPTGKITAAVSRGELKARGTRPAVRIAGHRSTGAGAGKPSVVRRAITLLLNHPDAGQKLDVGKLAGVTKPGTDLLREIIETLQAEPNMTTAGILERWRNREDGRHLGKLAAIEVPDDEDFDAAAELEHSLDQLAAFRRRERVDNLIEKERLSKLSEAERAELREHRREPDMRG